VRYGPWMARPPATPEHRAKVRRKIRQAAADVYNSEGPGAVSIRTIAKRADVSVGTIYAYFGSLQGLMESLWSGSIARYAEALKQVSNETEDPVERLRRLMQSYVDFAYANPEIYRGVFMLVRPSKMEVSDKRPAAQGVFAAFAIEAIKAGQDAEQLKPGDPTEIGLMVWGGLHGCLALPNNFGRLEFGDTSPLLERYIDTTIAALET